MAWKSASKRVELAGQSFVCLELSEEGIQDKREFRLATRLGSETVILAPRVVCLPQAPRPKQDSGNKRPLPVISCRASGRRDLGSQSTKKWTGTQVPQRCKASRRTQLANCRPISLQQASSKFSIGCTRRGRSGHNKGSPARWRAQAHQRPAPPLVELSQS